MIHKPARSRSIRPLSAGVAACSLLLVLAGCGGGEGPLSSSSGGTAARAPAPAGVSRDALVGRWGIASFHTEKDRKRTEAEARAQCKQPYTIAQGPGDGVIMHVADDPKPYELRLKAGAGSKTYLGFEAPAGDPQLWSDTIPTLAAGEGAQHGRTGQAGRKRRARRHRGGRPASIA